MFPEEDIALGPSMVAMLQLENAELRQRVEDLTAHANEGAVPDGTRRVLGGFYVRDRAPHPPPLRRSSVVDRPSHLIGSQCYACGVAFEPLTSIVLVPIGPGADPCAREKWQNGAWTTAVAIPLHSKCAGEP